MFVLWSLVFQKVSSVSLLPHYKKHLWEEKKMKHGLIYEGQPEKSHEEVAMDLLIEGILNNIHEVLAKFCHNS